MPMAMKVWNTYRSRMIGQIMQREGLCVIPTLSWAEEATYTFCFDGIEPGGVVAVSTVGVARSKEARQLWFNGMDEAYPCRGKNPASERTETWREEE